MLDVIIQGPIDYTLLRRFHQEVVPRIEQSRQLNLYIDSAGGIVQLAMALARFLTSLDNVWTYNIGTCNSAAILLFAAGKERIADERGCTFFFHEVEKQLQGGFTLSTLSQEIKQLQKDTHLIAQFLTEQTGQPQDLWLQYMQQSRTLDGNAAHSLNLATQCNAGITDNPSHHRLHPSSLITILNGEQAPPHR